MTRILLETHWLNEFSVQVQTKAFAVMLRHSGGLPRKPFVTKMAKNTLIWYQLGHPKGKQETRGNNSSLILALSQ